MESASADTGDLGSVIQTLVESAMSKLGFELQQAGWEKGPQDAQEPDRQTLKDATELARHAWLKNPWIRRAVDLQASYVTAQGFSVKAQSETPRASSEKPIQRQQAISGATLEDEPDEAERTDAQASAEITQVLQDFLDDAQNRAELTGQQAFECKDRELGLDGELFFAFFTNEATGKVRLASVQPHQIEQVITNPENSKQPWFYLRSWEYQGFDLKTGPTGPQQARAYYPDLRYQPSAMPETIGEIPVRWKNPVLHVKVGGFSNWLRGFPEVEVARPYATAYKDFIGNWASIAKALARFTWKYSGSASAQETAAVTTKVASTLGRGIDTSPERNPAPLVGSLAAVPAGRDLQPIRTAGATVAAEDGKQLRVAAIAPLGFPDPFYGDADQSSLATAKSLDRPTELRIRARQRFWADVYRSIFDFVIVQAVQASSGPLRHLGQIRPVDIFDPDAPRSILWNRGARVTINTDWPQIVEPDLLAFVQALVQGSPFLPAELVARLAMVAFEVDGVENWLAQWKQERVAALALQTAVSRQPEQSSSKSASDSREDDLSAKEPSAAA